MNGQKFRLQLIVYSYNSISESSSRCPASAQSMSFERNGTDLETTEVSLFPRLAFFSPALVIP